MSKHFINIKLEKLPHSEVEITGSITAEFIQECRKDAIKELNTKVNFPGFRPGHIPEETLVKRLGEGAVLEESAEIALAKEFSEIIRESKSFAIGRPTVAITKLIPDSDLEFKITTAVEPNFDLPDYKKLAQDANKTEDQEKRRLNVIDSLIKETKIEVPPILVQVELEKMLGQFKDDIAQAGLKWEDYLKSIKKTESEIQIEWKEQALKRAKAELIVMKIAEVEKIEPDPKELEHEIEHLLSHYSDADPFRIRMYVYTMMRNEKVFEFLENQK